MTNPCCEVELPMYDVCQLGRWEYQHQCIRIDGVLVYYWTDRDFGDEG